MNHGTTKENHHKGACPLCGGLGDEGGDGADAGVGCRESDAVVADDKDDLALNAKVADLAKGHFWSAVPWFVVVVFHIRKLSLATPVTVLATAMGAEATKAMW